MHAGGGHIESYLMLSLPFITLLFVNSAHSLTRSLMGIVLFIIGFYTLLVTFSRGGYIGFSIGFVVLLLALLVCFRKHLLASKKVFLRLPLLGISLVMALPVLHGSMIQQRFSVVGEDRDSRTFHWHDALACGTTIFRPYCLEWVWAVILGLFSGSTTKTPILAYTK